MSTTWLHYKINDSLGPASKLTSMVAVLVVAYLLKPHLLLAVLLLLAGLLPFLMYKCIEFDLYRGVYRIGICIAGKTLGKEEPYPGVDFLFLKQNRHITETGSMHVRVNAITITFDGFIKLSDGTKALLIRVKNKKKAMALLTRMAKDLETEVRDFTDDRHY